ncbi:MAG: hypothetical protein HQL41_02905 [Alphaproteobacteria bacterium]|nr:hypothetical protein [Alphaproteobacteria bacterium]
MNPDAQIRTSTGVLSDYYYRHGRNKLILYFEPPTTGTYYLDVHAYDFRNGGTGDYDIMLEIPDSIPDQLGPKVWWLGDDPGHSGSPRPDRAAREVINAHDRTGFDAAIGAPSGAWPLWASPWADAAAWTQPLVITGTGC